MTFGLAVQLVLTLAFYAAVVIWVGHSRRRRRKP